MMNRILGILIVFIIFSCTKKTHREVVKTTDKLKVVTVNYPLFYFAERIGGELIDLFYIIPEDIDPAFWNPDEESLSVYQEADIIFKNGAGYANWMNNVSLPSSRIINTSASFDNDLISLNAKSSHSHGPDGEHEHEGQAFTTWLDLDLALKQAESIRLNLVKNRPEQSLMFNKNFEKLREDLLLIHNEMLRIGDNYQDQVLIASHPVYQYLGKAYKLNIKSVHFEPNEYPSEKQWENLNNLIKENESSIMLWEDEPMKQIMVELEQRNIKVVVFKPCGNKPIEGDFMTIMYDNLKNIKNNTSISSNP